MSDFLRQHLVCPLDHQPLTWHDTHLTCAQGHSYPLVDGTPVMLVDREGHRWIKESIELARSLNGKAPPAPVAPPNDPIDPFVREHLSASCGYLYVAIEANVQRYPIPTFPLPPGNGKNLLDVGCMWGRWTIAATKRGYNAIGIDPGLKAVMAAKRVAKQLGVEPTYVVADGRYMPFATRSFDAVFSYSVLQHFSMEDMRAALAQAGRVLKPGGTCLVQLAQTYGLRRLMIRVKRRFKPPTGFDSRDWSVPTMKRVFNELVGPSQARVDAFFNLNAQSADMDVLPFTSRVIVRTSETLRKISTVVKPLVYVADSVYIESKARGG